MSNLPSKPTFAPSSPHASSSRAAHSRTSASTRGPRLSDPAKRETWKNPLEMGANEDEPVPRPKRQRASMSPEKERHRDEGRNGSLHVSRERDRWEAPRNGASGANGRYDDRGERGYDERTKDKYDRYDERYDDRRGEYRDSRVYDDARDRGGRYNGGEYDRYRDSGQYESRARYGHGDREGREERYGRDSRRDQYDDRQHNGRSDHWEPSSSSRRRDQSREHGREYEESRSSKRRHSYSRSPRKARARTRSPSPEDGEISDTAPKGRPDTPPMPPPSPPGTRVNPYSNNGRIKTLKIRDRPVYNGPPPVDSYLAPPPPKSPAFIPPPPPEEVSPLPPAPPTPLDTSDTPQVPQAPAETALPPPTAQTPPRNKALEAIKVAPQSAPHAPNRNLANPTTRASTPQPARTGTVASLQPCPRVYKRLTMDQEEKAYGRVFKGTTSLMAYDLGKKLGEGTFGVVTKGVEKMTKVPIALKKLIIHNQRDGVSVTTIREIKILKSLNHPNVVPILNMVVEPSQKEKSSRQDVFMVFPYMDHDLCGLLANTAFKKNHSMPKLFMRQLLEGIAHIHDNGFLHRDIKTANLLIKHDGTLMIADFGLARAMHTSNLPKHSEHEYTNMVVTRWYRAPELLLGETKYGPAVDMWSIGCVLGEMYKREPILPGGPNDEHQLIEIASRCGPWNEKTFPGWTKLPGFPGWEGHNWAKYSLGEKEPSLIAIAKSPSWAMDKEGVDLMMKLLRLDPTKRLTSKKALAHPWFTTGASAEKTKDQCIGVSSSHEMTMKNNAPPPAPAHRPRPAPANGQAGYGMAQRPFQNQPYGQPNLHPHIPPPHMAPNGGGPTWAGGNRGAGGPVNPYGGTNRPQQEMVPPGTYSLGNRGPGQPYMNNGIPPLQNGHSNGGMGHQAMHRGGPPNGMNGMNGMGMRPGPPGGPPPMPFKLAGGKVAPAPFALAGSGANRGVPTGPASQNGAGGGRKPTEGGGLPY